MRKTFIRDALSVFFLYGIIFIPFPFWLTSAQLQLTDLVFGRLIGFVSTQVFATQLHDTRVYSDFVSMYALLLLLIFFSLFSALLINQWKNWRQYREKVLEVISVLLTCYLCLQLLKYGADKLFKNQFYLPEPNILYTPLGKVHKDLLFWSTMGVSHFYSLFLGITEMVAAVFLFFRRTRLAGLLLATGILLNVTAINFAFDISVKLLSSFLFLLALFLLRPYYNRVAGLLFTGRRVEAAAGSLPLIRNVFWQAFAKFFTAGLICLETFYPVIQSGQLNDDKAPRPFLHGVYQVLLPLTAYGLDSAVTNTRRFYIHRDGYIIFERMDNSMTDYRLQYDTLHKQLLLTDYEKKQMKVPYDYRAKDSVLSLYFPGNGNGYVLEGQAIDWRNLPALQKGFHWTADGGY